MTHSVTICIGSNIANKVNIVQKAADYFIGFMDNVAVSPVLISDDFTALGDCYANIVISGTCHKSADEWIMAAREYETNHGRTPLSKSLGIMPVDVDLVTFDNSILKPQQFHRPYFRRAFELLCPLHK